MRHARSEALDELEDVLSRVRAFEGLTERKRGTFYRKSSAFLHFHDDSAGLFADVRVGKDWQRFRVSTVEERALMLTCVDGELRGQPQT
jgi:hypothetical protein